MEKDDEVVGVTGASYTAEFWQYDSRLGRRWNVDPKPHPSISFYATFSNNPIFYTDMFGDSVAIFNKKGIFQAFQDDGKEAWSWERGDLTDEGAWVSLNKGAFNDPDVDVLAIKNYVSSGGRVGIGKLSIMSDKLVDRQLDRSGVRTSEAQDNPLSFANEAGRGGKMDYGVKGIESGDLNKFSFYVRENVAYNVGDIGNYLWGKGMGELKIGLTTSRIGAHVNNMVNGRSDIIKKYYDFGPGTYGSPGIFDSEGDQRAIRAGYITTPYFKQLEIEAQKKLDKIHNNMINGFKW